MIKSFALFVMGLAIAGFNYKICCCTTVPKQIIPVQCELGAVTTRSLPQEASADKNKVESSQTTDWAQSIGASIKLVKGGDDQDEDEKDDAKDKDDSSERLWDSVMLG